MKRFSLTHVLATMQLLATATIGCGGTESDPFWELEQQSAAIISGTIDAHYRAVGALAIVRDNGSQETCTGSLVGYQTVLTAAHCIAKLEQGQLIKTTSATFVLDGHFEGSTLVGGKRFRVSDSQAHPLFTQASVTSNDIGLMRLENPPDFKELDIEPLTIAGAAPHQGLQIKVVGYGLNSVHGDRDDRRVAINTITNLGTKLFTMSARSEQVGTFCLGDSGGPSLGYVHGQEVIVGVHSFVDNEGSCSKSSDTRVDPYREWLLQTAQGDVRVSSELAPGTVDPATLDGSQPMGSSSVQTGVVCQLGGRTPPPSIALILVALAPLLRRRRDR